MSDTPVGPATAPRYPESKERSAELLRLALVRMSARAAALNPLSFAVWYEHLSGTNAELSRAFESAERADPALGDASIRRLYDEYVMGVRERATARVGGGLDRLMNQMADAASQTGQEAGQFGQTLATLSRSLQADDLNGLTAQFAQVQSRTARMADSMTALHQQLEQTRDEVSRLRGELQNVRSESLTCPLTHVLNRKGFDERLAEMLATPAAPGRQHCLVMLDIDHFKRVNDTHGHVLGDRVLAAVGTILGDLVTDPRACAARYGGEEFAVVLPASSLARATEVAEAVRTAVARMKVKRRNTDQEVLRITLSAGVAAQGSNCDGIDLVQCADEALYSAKRNGRDRTVVAGTQPAC